MTSNHIEREDLDHKCIHEALVETFRNFRTVLKENLLNLYLALGWLLSPLVGWRRRRWGKKVGRTRERWLRWCVHECDERTCVHVGCVERLRGVHECGERACALVVSRFFAKAAHHVFVSLVSVLLHPYMTLGSNKHFFSQLRKKLNLALRDP